MAQIAPSLHVAQLYPREAAADTVNTSMAAGRGSASGKRKRGADGSKPSSRAPASAHVPTFRVRVPRDGAATLRAAVALLTTVGPRKTTILPRVCASSSRA